LANQLRLIDPCQLKSTSSLGKNSSVEEQRNPLPKFRQLKIDIENDHCDKIGPIFAHWAIVHSGQFGNLKFGQLSSTVKV
jgi:hypothetical protein